MIARWILSCLALASAATVPAAGIRVRNGDFENVVQVNGPGSPDIGFGAWKIGGPSSQAPKFWRRNPAYPGTLTVGKRGAHSGTCFIHIAGSGGKRPAHLFQPIPGIRPGACCRVSAWIRNGRADLGFYEYHRNGPIRAPVVCHGRAGKEWRRIVGWYIPDGKDFKNASLFIQVPRGGKVDVDAVRLEAITPAEAPAGRQPVVIENDSVRIELSPAARLTAFVDKATGRDYAAPAPAAALPLFRAQVQDTDLPAQFLKREGRTLRLQFADAAVSARIRIEPKHGYFLIEVLETRPAGLGEIAWRIPLKRLAVQGPAFCANYGKKFAACAFALDLSGECALRGAGPKAVTLTGVSRASRGGVNGAKFALVACPRADFETTIQRVEQENGLPCPKLDGKWIRESEPIRRSYLFVIGMTEQDTDALIDYAKIGGFETILILKNAWLETHGHYRINRKSFPGGLADFKRTVDKMHAAGLKVGVHLFGPSISPNDPYVAPVPDDRLLSVQCPPLAKPVDAKTTVLALTAQPKTLPPARPRRRSFPGYYLRIGNEIIRYGDVRLGPPFRFVGCRRGACGTTAAAHPAGAQVRGLLALWGFFLFDPHSTLLDEITTRFARIVNQCKLDMVYFDASEGAGQPYFDGRYYVLKSHLAYYRKFDHDVLYQTSMGTGTGLLWHIVARSASADGHGDIKRYLDQRLGSILAMKKNFTFADIGWYGLDPGSRVDRLEYIAAKCLGSGGSISVQCNRSIFESHPHARQIMEMLNRYERCRIRGYFPMSVRNQLLEKGQEFKLYQDDQRGWRLFHAAYAPDRIITRLDGRQNAWRLENDRPGPTRLALEITRDASDEPGPDYGTPDAIRIENFENLDAYAPSRRNRFARFVRGPGRRVTARGVVRKGTTMQFIRLEHGAREGKACALYTAANTGVEDGWTGIGRRFEHPLDLSACRCLAMWVYGDAKNAVLMIQLRDVTGRHYQWRRKIGHKGWKLLAFPIPARAAVDWKKIDYLLFYYNNIPAHTTVACKLDGLEGLPRLSAPDSLTGLTLTVNGRRIELPGRLGRNETLETDGLGHCTIWPGGMRPGRKFQAPQTAIRLQPGRNELRFTCTLPPGKQPDVALRLIRLWPVSQ